MARATVGPCGLAWRSVGKDDETRDRADTGAREGTVHISDAMTSPVEVRAKPRDDEIDVHGLTHKGLVRRENQDHFLICSLHKQMKLYLTSIPEFEKASAERERLAFLAMVADGVGGGMGGGEASRLALSNVSAYVSHALQAYYGADATDDDSFRRALQQAALRCHEDIARRAETDPGLRGMATTLTLYIGVWPRLWLLQVGDSRYYQLRDGKLMQLTRDQTMAQDLVDLGVFTAADQARSPLSNVLSSALGGERTTPVVTVIDNEFGRVHMLCSDGLTKHVSDDRIRERLVGMNNAKEACEQLLQDALDAGGTDNITIIVGRAVRRAAS